MSSKMHHGYTLRPLVPKVLGGANLDIKPAGTACRWQRSPYDPGVFLVWFTPAGSRRPVYARVDAIDLPDTVSEQPRMPCATDPTTDYREIDDRR